MSSSNLVRIGYKKEAAYGVTPVGVKSSLVVQDITYTAVLAGESGDDYSVEYLDTVSAGAEVATLSGKKISVAMEDGVSTATQVQAALTANTAIAAVVGHAITGTGSDTQNAVTEDFLENGIGEMKTARFVSEQYSGTPQTTESQQIRTDRMSSGQVVTGLAVDGGHNFELAKEEAIEDFLESAMCNEWETYSPVTANFSINMTTKKLIRSTGSFVDEGVKVGQFLKLTNFASAGNNAPIFVMAVSALEVTFANKTGMVTAASESATYQRYDQLSIGSLKKSFSIEKTFTDLTTRALLYRGCMVAQMELNVEYGSLVNGSFQTQGNAYEAADTAAEMMSYETDFAAPATTVSMNGSVDMPFLASDVTGTWGQDSFCIQNLNLTLNNNLTVQNCIGRVAPENYSQGTAGIKVTLSSYLKDGNWGLLAKKLTQESFAIGFLLDNTGGKYGFFLPAIQVSFDDPQSAGANQEISMDMQGTAKVGATGESALTIFREPA